MQKPDLRQDLRRFHPADIATGLGVAGLMLPEAVAYAGIAGLPAGRALMTGIAGGLAYVLVGRSRFAVVAPTSSSAAILAAAIAGLTLDAGITDPLVKGALATALVGIVGLIFAGLCLFRLGSLAGFVSRPVLRGFALGLAITIIIKQLPKLFGVSVAGGSFWQVLENIALAAPRWNLPSLIIGIVSLVALLVLRRWPQWPGALGVIGAGVALGVFAAPEHWGVSLVGQVSLSLTAPSLPPLALLPRLVQLAAPIALILFAESWGTMRTLALKHGDALDANRELGALGLANIASALAQGMPAGAGFSAGSASEAAGASGRLAATAAALGILGLALFATPLIARIPEPVLAAIVIAALTHALDPAPIVRLFRLHRDHWVALTAAVGVLALGVLDGMLAAIGLSIAMLLYDMAHPSISELGRVGDSHDFIDIKRHADAQRIPGLAIWRPNAPLFFANAESSLNAISAHVRAAGASVLILSLEESANLDATAIDCLAECASALEKSGLRVILARAHDLVREILVTAGHGDLAQDSTYSVADAAAAADAHRTDSTVNR